MTNSNFISFEDLDLVFSPTSTEIAEDFDLWGHYVDPDATMTREQFDALTVSEKIDIQREVFGQDIFNK